MTDPDAITDALDDLDAARAAWRTFEERWTAVAETLARSGSHAGAQIEAYQPFVRDQGMGDGPDAWLDRAETALRAEAGC